MECDSTQSNVSQMIAGHGSDWEVGGESNLSNNCMCCSISVMIHFDININEQLIVASVLSIPLHCVSGFWS